MSEVIWINCQKKALNTQKLVPCSYAKLLASYLNLSLNTVREKQQRIAEASIFLGQAL